MKTHIIEWKHYDRGGRTCERCGDTGAELRALVTKMNPACGPHGVRFQLVETKLPETRLAESNTILLDGVPLERLVPGATVVETPCESCGELLGAETNCRALSAGGVTHEVIPADIIRAAVCREAGCCGEGCDCDCGCAGERAAG